MSRRRVKMSRMGDSVRGSNLNSAYEYYKRCHEQNQEELKRLLARMETRRQKKFYTFIFGKREDLPIERALSFADENHILKAVCTLKCENPRMHLSLEALKRRFFKEILTIIVENYAIEDSGYLRSGTLYIL